jgi:hypothetical protein
MSSTKSILFGLLFFALAANSFASISTPPTEKSYNFVVRIKSEKFEYSQKAGSWEEAYRNAAQACFNYFKAGRRVSMDEGEAIINSCANPRSI